MNKTSIALFMCLLLSWNHFSSADRPFLRSVNLSKVFFNPTIGESCEIKIDVASDGELDVAIVDRDGFIVRELQKHKNISAGIQEIAWDGRNDTGIIVPDEAYSLKMAFRSKTGIENYFPANGEEEELISKK